MKGWVLAICEGGSWNGRGAGTGKGPREGEIGENEKREVCVLLGRNKISSGYVPFVQQRALAPPGTSCTRGYLSYHNARNIKIPIKEQVSFSNGFDCFVLCYA